MRVSNSRSWGTTIHDVARGAGVATSTVSCALSGEPRVAEATRERVVRIAAELGYRPSRSARALRSSRTHTLGLTFPSLQNPIALEQLGGTVREAYELGYTVFVSDAQNSPEIQAAELSRMIEHRVDGVILGRGIFHLDANLVEFLKSGMPIEGNPDVPADGALNLMNGDRIPRTRGA